MYNNILKNKSLFIAIICFVILIIPLIYLQLTNKNIRENTSSPPDLKAVNGVLFETNSEEYREELRTRIVQTISLKDEKGETYKFITEEKILDFANDTTSFYKLYAKEILKNGEKDTITGLLIDKSIIKKPIQMKVYYEPTIKSTIIDTLKVDGFAKKIEYEI